MDKIKNFIKETKEVEKIYATPFKRVMSFLVDLVIISIILSLFASISNKMGFNLEFYKEEVIIQNQEIENNSELDKNKTTLYNQESEPMAIRRILTKDGYWSFFIISSLYFMIFLSSKKQATIGNQIFKIMVVHIKDGRLNPLHAFLRWVATIINNQILFLGYLLYFFNKDRAFLQDLLTETRVINLKKGENDAN